MLSAFSRHDNRPPYAKRAMAQTIALEGIISCSVFHFHGDTLIFRFHELRHSYAVAAIKSGDDIKTVQGNLGHATASFTLDIYGHVTEQMKRESADRMEQFIKNVSAG